jgi:hypothetical protein
MVLKSEAKRPSSHMSSKFRVCSCGSFDFNATRKRQKLPAPGRTIGYLAHAIDQLARGHLVSRPSELLPWNCKDAVAARGA